MKERMKELIARAAFKMAGDAAHGPISPDVNLRSTKESRNTLSSVQFVNMHGRIMFTRRMSPMHLVPGDSVTVTWKITE